MSDRRPIRVLQARPPGIPGAAALDDLALITVEGLRELGHPVERVSDPGAGGIDADALTLLIGGHLLEGRGVDALPPEVVVYNALPIPSGGVAARFPEYARLLARNPVWDVARPSLDALAEASSRDGDGLQHVPPGWVPALGRLPVARAQDIAVLFMGPMDRRRWRLMAELEAQGQSLRHVADVTGSKRDALVARARLVLELAPLEDQIPEPTRLVYLLANRKAVLAEATPELENDPVLRAGLRLAPFDEIARALQRLGHDVDGRHALELRGLDAVRRRDAATVLKRALARLPAALTRAAPARARAAVAGPARPAVAGPARPTAAATVAGPAPTVLNLNGGRDPIEEALNLELPDTPMPAGVAAPDIVADPCDPELIGRVFDTARFGAVVLGAGGFGRILAPWVPARVPDLVAFMATCLTLLAEDGALELLVPYDLSHGAWSDPANRRAFNEHSFTAFTEGHAAIGWTEARFHLDSLEFAFTALGERLERDGAAVETILGTPRAVDAMRVVLRKRSLR
ncbi:hypothetical protein [Roseospira goensis]|uniref:Uncharacterized protein n=1 Tax=Roseospira goensis TaxID=391922 RepID=A0A7W6S024_9PROT|nr:hypothetical protein [Roseospira goensis]MBB4286383.1 hypothetical protein [Roseospira goensis]